MSDASEGFTESIHVSPALGCAAPPMIEASCGAEAMTE
jgi:hypothetical protein